MNLVNLNRYVGLIDEAILTLAPARVRQLEWLRYDLDTVCRGQLAAGRMPGASRKAWYRVTGDRLMAIVIPTRIAGTINRLISEVRSESGGTSLRLLFGQMRIAPTFQAANVNQLATPGFPNDLPGSQVAQAVERLQTGTYLSDQIPISIFWHLPANRWTVANNRGFTAHCAANVRPLRMYPTQFLPTDIEITRLAEVEGQGGVPHFTGPRGGEPNPRTLPSTRMFITPIGAAITQIVTVPDHWG